MRPPASIIIVGHRHEVIVVDDTTTPLGPDIAGQPLDPVGRFMSGPAKIWIRSAESGVVGLSQERDTVLHEVVHALNYLMRNPDTESVVCRTATGLLQVLRENPDLVAYLTEHE